MKINNFSFGCIEINGKEYKEDVIVTKDRVKKIERTHTIKKDIMEKALMTENDLVIVGTGKNGMVKVTEEAKRAAREEVGELIIEKTPIAIKNFNSSIRNKRVVGIFHLTC